ncbi:MAG: hypothetical protein GY807_13835 [Gammaproteobacteria bacterium]|nr:hypothetical protein [Gammaproteobacteria bacterium]
MKYEQMGRFSIPAKLVRDNPERVAQVFSIIGCVPVWADETEDGLIEYKSVCELFDALDDGDEIPEYVLRIEWEGATINGVSVERVE